MSYMIINELQTLLRAQSILGIYKDTMISMVSEGVEEGETELIEEMDHMTSEEFNNLDVDTRILLNDLREEE